MSLRKRLLVKPPSGALVPSEHFGVVLYEGDGSSSHSINGGKFGAAFYGNGSNSRIDVSSIGGFPSGNEPRTISFWMYSDSYANGGIVAYGTASSNQGFAFYIGSSQLIMTFYAVNANINYALSTGQWYHVVATHDGSTFKAYINGSEEYSDTRTLNTGTAGFRIGGVPWNNSSEFFNGKIDQVRVFQKALSSSEVSTLYAETAATVESLDPLSEDTTDTLQVLGDSSCVATYRFENNEDDLSGNYDGTGYEVQYAAGRYGQAASFDGSNSYVSGNVAHGDDYSVSAWVYPESHGYQVFYQAREDSANLTQVGQDTTGGNGTISVANKANNTWTVFYTTSEPLATLNQWYHIVVNFTSSDAKIYVNGNFVESHNAYTSTPNYSAFNIGATNTTSYSGQWDGKIDQLRLFNKALSASEVTTLYQENSLVASYRFEGNANDDTRNYDGTASNVTYEYGVNFTPDFIWYKTRTQAYDHNLTDSTRGTGKQIRPNRNIAEVSATDHILSFDTGGFTVGSGGDANKDGDDYVAWCLKANGGTTSSNTDGDITSTVQANTQAGFSIVTWTSTSDSSDTIGHGLNSKPDVVLYKKRSSTGSWFWYTDLIDGSWDELVLNSTDAKSDFAGTYATNTTFKSVTSSSGADWVTYCFHSVENFSKFGTYVGTGDADDRPIIETGFEPAFVMIKNADDSNTPHHWNIYDNKRNTTNPRDKILEADTSDADLTASTTWIDFLSNGFQIGPATSGRVNGSGKTYIYMAFAADPDTEAPTLAKSFSTVTYDGTGSAQTIEGLGFAPSLVWIKNRAAANSHNIYDTIRGATKLIESDTSDAEVTSSTGLTAFTDDGFTVSTGAGVNNSSGDYVAWAWKADDNEPTINTEGSLDSLVSANANAGFSIVKYEGNGTSGATIGHGLSAKPELIITKNLIDSVDWNVKEFSTMTDDGDRLELNDSAAIYTASSGTFILSTTNSTTIGLGNSSRTNGSGDEMIAYCFHSVSGFSKFGSYSGSGASGNAQNVGFAPDLVILKSTNAVTSWGMFDTVRGANVLYSNLSNAESSDSRVTLTSTGFEFTGAAYNESGRDWIYMAFKIN